MAKSIDIISSIEANVVKDSEGSSALTLSGSQVVTSVHGPHYNVSDVSSLDTGTLIVSVKSMINMDEERCTQLEALLHDSLVGSIDMDLFRGACISLQCQILKSSDSDFAALFNSAIISICLSNIQVKDLLVAGHIFAEGGLHLNVVYSKVFDSFSMIFMSGGVATKAFVDEGLVECRKICINQRDYISNFLKNCI